MNCLLHEEKAIVSNIHGTTRDVIEDTTEIQGITFRFIDTAGLRNTDDQVEQLGIERSYKKLAEARIILWVVDATPSLSELSEMQARCEGKSLILVRNKVDETTAEGLSVGDSHCQIVSISAKYKRNIDQLEQLIYASANIPEINENSVIITSVRHYEALTRADESILRVIDALSMSLAGDLISDDLRICLDELADITGGQITPNEVLGNIFKHFCIGK